jgi:uroporphyrinogen decarboxylase
MTARERLIKLLNGEPVDRPPFMPAIYDLKPALLHRDPHTFGQATRDITEALVFEAEKLEADALTAAYDIYNVEAESVGCSLTRDLRTGMPEIERPILQSLDDIGGFTVPSELTGRMDIFVEAAEELLQRYEGVIPVRGGISGPFSMATKLFPQEELLMETMMHPERILPLLRFCADIITTYAKAFAAIGAGVVVFDSFVSPPLLPPQIYRDLILPFHRDIFHSLEDLGVLQRSLIIGGDTLPILPYMISSGATQFLLDFTVPLEMVRAVLQDYPDIVFRVNLPPSVFIPQEKNDLEAALNETLHIIGDNRNLIIGTGILPPDAKPANIIHAKRQITAFYQ